MRGVNGFKLFRSFRSKCEGKDNSLTVL